VALSGELTQSERSRALQALRDGRARVLVATDVAARGLDLPDVGLVIQADLPTNAEVFQHRSGRTGRAGRKGVCVLLVPSGSQRTAVRILDTARAQATWSPVPGPEEIRAKDRSRLLGELLAIAREPADEDLEVARELLRELPPEAIAAALVKQRRGALVEPEELPLSAQVAEKVRRPASQVAPRHPPSPRHPRPGPAEQREARTEPPAVEAPGGSPQAGPMVAGQRPGPRPPPQGGKPRRDHAVFRGSIWFEVNLGRSRNADPRWILPLLCRRGGVVKDEIGAIKIAADTTRFEIAAAAARRFEAAAGKPDEKDPKVRIVRVRT
jgi:ATP-dependent RNA helicase DeaD